MSTRIPVNLEGNITADPEFGTSNGTDFARFSIAVNERRLNEETNEWENGEPVFHRVVVFNRLAHNIAASVHKGDTVLVNGDLRLNNYTDKDGNAREGREIVASSVGPSLRFATATVVSNPPKVNSPAASATGPVATPEATGADIAR